MRNHSTATKLTSKANGTSLVGYIVTDYQTILEKIGNPLTGHSGDGKVNCEWIIEFEDGSIGTIYDWKMSEIPKKTYRWHIGGKGINVLDKVGQLLNLPVYT